jgi:hypothetical protein
MSVSCQQQTFRFSFDDLVGVGEQRRRHGEPKRLCGVEVDRQYEFGRLIVGNIAGICAAQDGVDVDCYSPRRLPNISKGWMSLEFGKAVVAAMRLVEAKITEHSPNNFPNRLDAEGYAEDEVEKLKAQISTIETELNVMLTGWEGLRVGGVGGGLEGSS